MHNNLYDLPARDKEGLLNVIVETPKLSRNKYTYKPEFGLFECGRTLAAGMSFMFDFGFIPSTQAQDGDPLDIIVLMDQPAFAGCLVQTRIIGVLEAEQTENGKTVRNDRLLGVHTLSAEYGRIERWDDLSNAFLEQIEIFFISKNEFEGKKFKPFGWKDADTAEQLFEKACKQTVK